MSNVNKIFDKSFSRGLDSDTKDALLSNQNYRYAENIKFEDGALVGLSGTDKEFVIQQYSVGVDIYLLEHLQARLLIKSVDKTVESIVLFYILEDNGVCYLKIKVVALDQSIPPYEYYSEQISSDLVDRYKKTTIDTEKIGQSGYDTIYFVDNIRPPRKLELILSSEKSDFVNLSLTSVLRRPGTDIYDVLINVNIVESETSQTLSQASKAFRAYVRSFRTLLDPSHPSINQSTSRLKFVDFAVGEQSKQVLFTIFPEDLDRWSFNLFYHKEDEISYSEFFIGVPSTLTLDVGVLPESQAFFARSDQDGSGSTTQVQSWEFFRNGPIFKYYLDTPTLQLGITKIYRSNLEFPSNLVQDGYHQDWNEAIKNNFFRVQGGVVTEFGINNGVVTVQADPTAYQPNIDLIYTPTNYNRLDTVEIALPASINGEDFVRADVGNSPVLLDNNISYPLFWPDQLNIIARYKEEVILRVDTVFSSDSGDAAVSTKTRRYKYSLEQPIGPVTFSFDMNVQASYTNENEGAISRATDVDNGLFIEANAKLNEPKNETLSLVRQLQAGQEMTLELRIDEIAAETTNSANAVASISFTNVDLGGKTPTKVRVDGVLLDYNIIGLNKLLD